MRSRVRFRYGFPYLHKSKTTVLRPSPHRLSIRANPLVHHSTELWGFSTDHGIPLAQKCSQSLTVLAVTRLANAQTARCFASRCGKPSGCAFDLGAAVNVIISEPGPAGESVGRWRVGGLVSRLWTIPSPVT